MFKNLVLKIVDILQHNSLIDSLKKYKLVLPLVTLIFFWGGGNVRNEFIYETLLLI